MPLFKLFLCYDRPWWEQVGVHRGQSVTDLPMRQCYYWDSVREDPGNHNAALMATYDDTTHTGFWSVLHRGARGDRLFEPRPNPHVRSIDPQWARHAPAAAVVDEVQRQLAEMHGLESIPATLRGGLPRLDRSAVRQRGLVLESPGQELGSRSANGPTGARAPGLRYR